MEILWKRGEIAPKDFLIISPTIFCYLLLDFHVENRDHVFTSRQAVIRDKRNRDNECRLYVSCFQRVTYKDFILLYCSCCLSKM